MKNELSIYSVEPLLGIILEQEDALFWRKEQGASLKTEKGAGSGQMVILVQRAQKC